MSAYDTCRYALFYASLSAQHDTSEKYGSFWWVYDNLPIFKYGNHNNPENNCPASLNVMTNDKESHPKMLFKVCGYEIMYPT